VEFEQSIQQLLVGRGKQALLLTKDFSEVVADPLNSDWIEFSYNIAPAISL
jgi:hypothetical protein